VSEALQSAAEVKGHLAVRRRNFFICAAIFASSVTMHPVLFGGLHLAIAGVQLAWATSFVVLGVLVGGARMSVAAGGVVTSLVSTVALGIEVHLSGGVSSPYFPAFYTLPLVMAVFVPDERSPVITSIVSALAALVLVCVLSQTPSQIIVSHAMMFSFAGLVSFYGAQTYRRLIGAEKKAHQERLEALEHLAESERRRVQAERTRAELERLALVGQLASGVAHEVNNPLAFVKANLRYLHEELIEHPGPLSPAELRTVLEETEQGVLRIQQIVSDLRQFSREVTEDEACAVPEALEEALRLAPERLPGLGEVVRELEPGLPQVRMGQRHLVQVVLNLLDNALGAIESAPARRPPRIVLRAREDSGGVRLDIEDNGPGIPADVLPRLFEPFFTTRYNSKGLGLALCREHAVRAGGSLVAENLPEGGARFVLRLPGAGQARRAAGE